MMAIHPDFCIGGLVTMTNLGLHAHRPIKALKSYPVQAMRTQRARTQVTVSSHYDLSLVAAQFDHIKRRSSGNTQALALSYSEVVDASMSTNYFAGCRYQLSGSIGQL